MTTEIGIFKRFEELEWKPYHNRNGNYEQVDITDHVLPDVYNRFDNLVVTMLKMKTCYTIATTFYQTNKKSFIKLDHLSFRHFEPFMWQNTIVNLNYHLWDLAGQLESQED